MFCVSSPFGARGVDARVLPFPPQPRVTLARGCFRAIGAGQSAERSLSTVVHNSVDCVRPSEGGCPQSCALLWKRSPYVPLSFVVSRETCGTPLQIVSGLSSRR